MKTLNRIFLMIVAMAASFVVASCSNDNTVNEAQDASQDITTRAVGTKPPKFTAYIETNDINPLNAGEYYFTGTNPHEEVIDHVILFASNIRGTASSVQLYHNPNQTYILNNINTLVKPLQNKGIKVLLGLLGDHTGVGFANLTNKNIAAGDSLLNDFAYQVANCVTTYGLDGVDFDDEYAEYGKISGTPTPSTNNFGLLIQKVRELLPDKLITAFDYGGYTGFNQTTMNAISYMWPNFGCSSNPPSGLPKSKWAKLSLHYTSGWPTCDQIQNCASSYNGYGAVMSFNLRNYDCSGTMNCFAPYVWGGRTVSYTGTSYSKNY